MKGNSMKEKVIFTLSLAVFIGIMWLSSTTKTANVTPSISEERIVSPQASNTADYIDNVSPDDVIYAVDGTLESDVSTLKNCSFNPIETDVFTFGEAFQYYRQCLGSDSNFHWKGSAYTTLLSKEVIMQVADSVEVKEKVETNNQVSEIR